MSNRGLLTNTTRIIPYLDSEEWVDVVTVLKDKTVVKVNQKSFIENLRPTSCPIKTCFLRGGNNCGVAYTAGNLRVSPDAPF